MAGRLDACGNEGVGRFFFGHRVPMRGTRFLRIKTPDPFHYENKTPTEFGGRWVS